MPRFDALLINVHIEGDMQSLFREDTQAIQLNVTGCEWWRQHYALPQCKPCQQEHCCLPATCNLICHH